MKLRIVERDHSTRSAGVVVVVVVPVAVAVVVAVGESGSGSEATSAIKAMALELASSLNCAAAALLDIVVVVVVAVKVLPSLRGGWLVGGWVVGVGRWVVCVCVGDRKRSERENATQRRDEKSVHNTLLLTFDWRQQRRRRALSVRSAGRVCVVFVAAASAAAAAAAAQLHFVRRRERWGARERERAKAPTGERRVATSKINAKVCDFAVAFCLCLSLSHTHTRSSLCSQCVCECCSRRAFCFFFSRPVVARLIMPGFVVAAVAISCFIACCCWRPSVVLLLVLFQSYAI